MLMIANPVFHSMWNRVVISKIIINYSNNIDDEVLKKVVFPPPYVPPPFESKKIREYLTEIDENDILFDNVIDSENNYLLAKKADTEEFFFKICRS